MTTTPSPLERGPRAGHDFRVVLVGILALVLTGIAISDWVRGRSELLVKYEREQGSGILAMESRTVPAFGSVQLAGSNNVTIRVGEQQSVQVYGDDNLIGRVTTDVDATTLVIGDKPGSYAGKQPDAS